MRRTAVIAYEDLQCPDSAAYRKMVDEKLRGRYGDTVDFEHRDFPLPKHEWARDAAVASRWFYSLSPELGSRFRAHCYAHQKAITVVGLERQVQAFAEDNGVAAMGGDDTEFQRAVEKDYQEGLRRGVSRTPTVFVNGETLIERFSVEEFSAAIEKS